MTVFSLNINHQTYELDLPPEMPLLWAIRDIVGLTGTKYSCGIGLCGTCTVHVDGVPVRSCQTLVSDVADKTIITIEGLSIDGTHPVQLAWIEHNVSQCGYCQPGQIMTAAALLASNPNPTDQEIESTMSGVLCRCGTYQRIRQAMQAVSKRSE